MWTPKFCVPLLQIYLSCENLGQEVIDDIYLDDRIKCKKHENLGQQIYIYTSNFRN